MSCDQIDISFVTIDKLLMELRNIMYDKVLPKFENFPFANFDINILVQFKRES